MAEDLEKYKYILKQLVEVTKDLSFEQENNEKAIVSLFYKRMLSSAQAILSLTYDLYSACILSSHMLEGLIFLTWILNNPKQRIKKYVAFGLIEQLSGLHIYPDMRDKLLTRIKQTDFRDILKKSVLAEEITDDILLNPENYYTAWYKPEANNLYNIVEQLTQNEKHQEITNIKHLYDRVCAYKHYAPYVMLPRYSSKSIIDLPDELIAVSIALQVLYISFLYLNERQKNPINIEYISKQYDELIMETYRRSSPAP